MVNREISSALFCIDIICPSYLKVLRMKEGHNPTPMPLYALFSWANAKFFSNFDILGPVQLENKTLKEMNFRHQTAHLSGRLYCLGCPGTSRSTWIPWREGRPRRCHYSVWNKRRERWHRFSWTTRSTGSGWSTWPGWTTWNSWTQRSFCKSPLVMC